MPAGCAFAARCSLAIEACRAAPPALERVGDVHEAACLRWRDARA
jgi:peptide/nickel transport system ATP-binding protein